MIDGGLLYLFADTNVFLQCKPLQDLKWDGFGSWERIELVITRPVQAEIDSLKDGGNARKAARARLASSLIHELLDAEGSQKQVHAQPLVHVSLRHELRREESIADVLDYTERDDQLVGTALKFLRSQPDGEVRLLTNDTGPKASARAVGVQYFGIPQDWLLAAEPDETEKQLNRLRAENFRLRTQEPNVELEAAAPFSERVQATLQVYRALTSSECDALIADLARRFPLATDFGSTHSEERVLDQPGRPLLLGQLKERFEPAGAERISEYEADYGKWLEECRTVLNKLSTTMNKSAAWPRLTVRMKNTGTRPAEDALLTLSVAGSLYLMPPKREDDDDDEEKETGPIALPRPPLAPKGIWRKVDPFSNLARTAVRDILARANIIGLDSVRTGLPYMPEPRDANDFYFKEGRRGRPGQLISYECDQWRHAGPPEEFEVDILCPLKPGMHRGLVTASAQAANLTDPVELGLPVSIEVQERSCLEEARALVEVLR